VYDMWSSLWTLEEHRGGLDTDADRCMMSFGCSRGPRLEWRSSPCPLLAIVRTAVVIDYDLIA
jgi:hypothetical protein